MTDEELLACKKITCAVAATYLQNGTTAQEIRVKAQLGICPFCRAEKMKSRYVYRIIVGALIQYKKDGLPTSVS